MILRETSITGCLELVPKTFPDARGTFVKVFQKSAFEKLGLQTSFQEAFYSTSKLGTIRGLHFHLPPKAQEKIVFCVSGNILDVAIDLRVGSPSYGQHHLFELSGDQANMAYLPAGLAHGFQALTEHAVVYYLVSTEYAPELDSGIRWDSAGISWKSGLPPIVSDRDRALPPLSEFQSPFRFGAGR